MDCKFHLVCTVRIELLLEVLACGACIHNKDRLMVGEVSETYLALSFEELKS